jgi:hypothetical protein
MGKPYSDDLRERVVAAIEAGHTRVKVAELYNMALSLETSLMRFLSARFQAPRKLAARSAAVAGKNPGPPCRV